jgi:hypothetical protein
MSLLFWDKLIEVIYQLIFLVVFEFVLDVYLKFGCNKGKHCENIHTFEIKSNEEHLKDNSYNYNIFLNFNKEIIKN